MKFYDTLIDELYTYLNPFPVKEHFSSDSDLWSEDAHQTMIFSKETAFELNGCGFNLVTSSELSDGVCVIGDDLSSVTADRNFCRVSIVQIDETYDEQIAYNLIKKIEFTKYHFFPKGYMMRTSSDGHKEKVRVSRSAIESGINFNAVGNLFIQKYKENKNVKAVKIIYVTHKDVDFSVLNKFAENAGNITMALDHVMSSVNFDCDTCKLKSVCDEVEGLRELHFKENMI